MRTVVVNGGKVIEVPLPLQVQLAETTLDGTTTPRQKHERICSLLRIGRFVPNPGHKPYALRAVILQIYDTRACTHTFGGWHECYSCQTNIDHKPAGSACPNCGKKGMQNFKVNEEKKPTKKRILGG